MSIDRSMRRFVSVACGPEWEVGTGTEGEWARPYARVTPSTGVNSEAFGARHRDLTQGWSVVAFPTAFPVTPTASLSEALRVERLLLDAFTRGSQAEFYARGRAHPRRIPIYSYEGVGEGEPASDHIGWARVLGIPSVGTITDDADESAIVVVADLRIGWSEGIAVDGGVLVQTVGLHPDG